MEIPIVCGGVSYYKHCRGLQFVWVPNNCYSSLLLVGLYKADSILQKVGESVPTFCGVIYGERGRQAVKVSVVKR